MDITLGRELHTELLQSHLLRQKGGTVSTLRSLETEKQIYLIGLLMSLKSRFP